LNGSNPTRRMRFLIRFVFILTSGKFYS